MKEVTKLKEKNLRYKQKIGVLKVIINDFAKRFINISSYKDNKEISEIIEDFIKFSNELK